MNLEDSLHEEIKKWSERLDREMKNTKPLNEKGKEFLVNIKAYRNDADYFLSKGDLIRSFETLIWAWAWLTIGKEIGILE